MEGLQEKEYLQITTIQVVVEIGISYHSKQQKM